MRGVVRDGLLFSVCVIAPCWAGWMFNDPSQWQWTHHLGAVLFVVATFMVFCGLRLLLESWCLSHASYHSIFPHNLRYGFQFDDSRDTMDIPVLENSSHSRSLREPSATSEIIHVEHGLGSARVVALLRMGTDPRNMHLLELDITGEDLHLDIIAEAVAGVASGELNQNETTPIERVGYANGWGLTVPCPPHRH